MPAPPGPENDVLLYGLIRGAGVFARAFPLSLAYALALLIADITFVLWRRGRRDMTANMAQVLAGAPTSEVRLTARHALRNYIKYLVDFLRAPGLTPDEVARR